MFQDRIEAGLSLAQQLSKYKNDNGIVLAIPRGGVPVGYAVARELGFPLELVLTKKIGHPNNKEYAIGAASLTDYFIVPHEEVPAGYIENELIKVRERLAEMQDRFDAKKEAINLEGKTVIIVDDGIATGNTLLATVQLIKKSRPKKIIIGVPVAPEEAVRKLTKQVDDLVVLLIPDMFYGVGGFYEDFSQVSDEEVIDWLNKSKKKSI
ncbi:MAG: phosphoribosyltransferase [Flavihumibacter sp.]|jgi:predicted phosphoribosyltransferase|nr:phosphoribosyltransferase [Flavihumibacter sp.]